PVRHFRSAANKDACSLLREVDGPRCAHTKREARGNLTLVPKRLMIETSPPPTHLFPGGTHMRRFPRGRLMPLVAGLIVAFVPATIRAEPAKAQKVLIETFDKVQLQGSWYPSGAEATKSPCVILLHKIGGNREQKGWESLAQQLQEKGFAVLS